MLEVLIAVAVGFLLGAVPLMIVLRLVVDESQRKDAQINGLLDRIQTPDPQERRALAYPEDDTPAVDWAYDDTGLVRVALIPDDHDE